MDNRRYVSRNPKVTNTTHRMADSVSGDPAIDGFICRHRETGDDKRSNLRPWGSDSDIISPGLMSDRDARYSKLYPKD